METREINVKDIQLSNDEITEMMETYKWFCDMVIETIKNKNEINEDDYIRIQTHIQAHTFFKFDVRNIMRLFCEETFYPWE